MMEPTTSLNRAAPPITATHAAMGSALSAGQSLLVSGVAPSAQTPFLLTLLPQTSQTVLIVVHLEADATRLATTLRRAFPTRTVHAYPAHAAYPYETSTLESAVMLQRLHIMHDFAADSGTIVVASWRAMLQATVAPDVLRSTQLCIRPDESHDPVTLTAQCVALGYRLVQTVQQPGDVRRHGGVVDVYPDDAVHPVRIEFFGNQIESIAHYDRHQQQRVAAVPHLTLRLRVEADWRNQPAVLERLRASGDYGMRDVAQQEWDAFLDPFSHNLPFDGMSLLFPLLNDSPPASIIDALPTTGVLVCVDPDTLISQMTEYGNRLEKQRTRLIHHGLLPAWYPNVVVPVARIAAPKQVLLLCDMVPSNSKRFVAQQALVHMTLPSTRRIETLSDTPALAETLPFVEGQFVCHIDHGIAVYEGIVMQHVAGTTKPYLKLRYAGADRLYVPEQQFDRVTCYGDPTNAPPALTILGKRDW
jgi:transcription-repair coupling factor (superfamily II helicase)